jgi:hypothetical protein
MNAPHGGNIHQISFAYEWVKQARVFVPVALYLVCLVKSSLIDCGSPKCFDEYVSDVIVFER